MAQGVLPVAGNISVLLADDHILVRQGIRRCLETAGDIEIVAEAGDGEEVLQLLVAMRPDVVLLDLHMPRLSGIEIAPHIKRDYPGVRILVLTGDGEDSQVLALLRAGVDGYLLKTAHIEEVIRAVREVYAGSVVLSPQITAKVVRQMAPATDSGNLAPDFPVEGPTARETAVLRLVAQGKTNREIGQALSISHRTVQGHLANLYGKLNVNTRTEAVTEALRLGWIDLK